MGMWEDSLAAIGDEPASISLDEYASRQNRLFGQLKDTDLIIITNPKESVRSNDVHYHYRSSSDMLYLTGWKDPESTFCAYQREGKWIRTLFVQPKDVLKEIWEGRRPGVEGAVEEWPVDEAYSIHDLEEKLSEMLVKCSRVFVKLGVDDSVDKIVEHEVKRNSRDRQKFGTGPMSIVGPITTS